MIPFDGLASLACRSCGKTGLQPILSLGETPLADRLLTPQQLHEPQITAPLELVFCPSCTLVQITVSIDPEILFYAEYPYFSSVSPALLAHSKLHAEELISTRELDGHSLVIELASNDGYLLKNFMAGGIPVLGIDPAPAPAAAAIATGVPTINQFFTHSMACELAADGRHADVVIANNVLAHVPDLNGFAAGIAKLLKDDGCAVIEAPYVMDLIDHTEFDTIYHQHLCYFSVHSVSALFERHGLVLTDLKHFPIHGGTLRYTLKKGGKPSAVVQKYLALEKDKGLTGIDYYRTFSSRVDEIRRELRDLLAGLQQQGKSIVGYGAAAKAMTLLTCCGIGQKDLLYIVDRNSFKHGRFMSGSLLEVLPVETLLVDRPDYLLILAWNFADEIMQQQAAYAALGGQFILPIPTPMLLTPIYEPA